jgi:glycosyltransferase involved in cell wall biosynthesis
MLKVLSIQSNVLGHKTYCETVRECFAGYDGVELSSYWYTDERSVPTRIINKMAAVSLPLLGSGGNNLDLKRARIEWAAGRTSKLLTERRLRKDAYSGLHFHTQVQAFGCASIMQAIPTVVTLDMTAFQVAREKAARYRRTFDVNVAMERKVFEAAAHIVTFSDWARRSVIGDHGIDGDKVTTISPGVRLWTIAEPSFEPRSKPRILFVGGDFKRKGGWDLVEVFSAAIGRKAELHLVTDEPALPRIDRVFVHRGVSAYTPQWHELFESCDIFVLPSHAEALGLVLQEAACFGLALIGSRVGGIPETVVDGENGFLMEPGDKAALARLLTVLVDDAALRMKLRRRSREIALRRFDAARNTRRLAELFERVAGTC